MDAGYHLLGITHLSEGLHRRLSRSALVGSRHDRAALTHQLVLGGLLKDSAHAPHLCIRMRR